MSVEHVSELSQQLVLVTGGARGLGACLVRAFARQGAKVVINYLKSEAAAQALAAELAALLPAKDPYLSPGEMIVLQVSRRHRRRVVSVELVKPFDD